MVEELCTGGKSVFNIRCRNLKNVICYMLYIYFISIFIIHDLFIYLFLSIVQTMFIGQLAYTKIPCTI